jgi:exodeoxyribonuclease VII small subunit
MVAATVSGTMVRWRRFITPKSEDSVMAGKRIDTLSFDATLDELEGIVQQMEQGELPLEDALKQFERGIQLVRAGQLKLTQAEQKVQILLSEQDHSELVPFEPQQGE